MTLDPKLVSDIRSRISDPDATTAIFARALVEILERRSVTRLLMEDVVRRVRMHPTTIARGYRAGWFPRPEHLGGRRMWREEVIEAWERECAAAPSVRKPRGVATWTPEQHRAREAAKREDRALAEKRGGKRGTP